VTVGKEESFEAQGLGSLCALYRFANAASGAVKTKLHGHKSSFEKGAELYPMFSYHANGELAKQKQA
jgi:hypothetical protein